MAGWNFAELWEAIADKFPDAQAQVRRNDFELVMTLDLTDADGAVYVDEYDWAFDFRTRLPSGYTSRGEYSVSPD